MNISKQWLLSIIAIFVFVGVLSSEETMDLQKQTDDVVDFVEIDKILRSSGFDFNLYSPEEFLEFLKKGAQLPFHSGMPPFYWMVNNPPDNWIKPEHIPELIKLINSQEPCSTIMTSISSTFPTKLSTIGDEAMCMIEGFLEKRYPPWAFSSSDYSPERRKNILQRWNDWNEQNDLQK